MARGDDIFGKIISASEVEAAALQTVEVFIDSYIGEMEQQLGWSGPEIARPKSYTTKTSVDRYPEEQLPQIIAISPGFSDPPVRRGKFFRASWSLGVAAVVSSLDEASTKYLARLYAAALRAAIVHHQSLGGIATGGVELMDESYDDIHDEEDTARTLGMGVVTFKVMVDNVLMWPGGPAAPAPPGTMPWTVEHVYIDIRREEEE